jgi:hypothetical protein
LADCHRDVQYFCDPLRRSGLSPWVIGGSRLDPDTPKPYYNLGIANFYAGCCPQAAADLGQSSQLNPRNSYTVIWLDMVDARCNRPSQFPRAVPQLEMTKWPAPVIRLCLGQATPEEVLGAADDRDADTKQRRVCEANFFIGQMARVDACEMPSSWGLAHAVKDPGRGRTEREVRPKPPRGPSVRDNLE